MAARVCPPATRPNSFACLAALTRPRPHWQAEPLSHPKIEPEAGKRRNPYWPTARGPIPRHYRSRADQANKWHEDPRRKRMMPPPLRAVANSWGKPPPPGYASNSGPFCVGSARTMACPPMTDSIFVLRFYERAIALLCTGGKRVGSPIPIFRARCSAQRHSVIPWPRSLPKAPTSRSQDNRSSDRSARAPLAVDWSARRTLQPPDGSRTIRSSGKARSDAYCREPPSRRPCIIFSGSYNFPSI